MHTKSAMQYLLAASTFMPAEAVYLRSIDALARAAPWIKWPDTVAQKRDILLCMGRKTKAQERLPSARQELREAEQELTQLQSSQSKKSVLTRLRIVELQGRASVLRDTVARLEQAAAYELPQQ